MTLRGKLHGVGIVSGSGPCAITGIGNVVFVQIKAKLAASAVSDLIQGGRRPSR